MHAVLIKFCFCLFPIPSENVNNNKIKSERDVMGKFIDLWMWLNGGCERGRTTKSNSIRVNKIFDWMPLLRLMHSLCTKRSAHMTRLHAYRIRSIKSSNDNDPAITKFGHAFHLRFKSLICLGPNKKCVFGVRLRMVLLFNLYFIIIIISINQ